jgi:hypothetical protein
VELPYIFSSSVNFPYNGVRILLTQGLEFISSQNTGPVLLKAFTALLRSCKGNFISFMAIFATPTYYFGGLHSYLTLSMPKPNIFDLRIYVLNCQCRIYSI